MLSPHFSNCIHQVLHFALSYRYTESQLFEGSQLQKEQLDLSLQYQFYYKFANRNRNTNELIKSTHQPWIQSYTHINDIFIRRQQQMNIKKGIYPACCGLTIFLGLSLIVIEIFFLQGLIRSQAEDGIVMTNQTYGLWGIIPGDTQTYTIRNFTVFNFTNAQDFIYRGSVVPKFVQVGGFLYQQKSQFINYRFDDQDKIVSFDYWLYFNKLSQSKDVDTKFSVINVAPLGFWMQLDSTAITSFSIQGFGGLFVQMNKTIKSQAIGQGVSSTFLQTFDTFNGICSQIGISSQYCWYLWNDRYYGLDNQVNIQFWVRAALENDAQTKQFLYEYFYPIPTNQFEMLLSQIKKLAEAMNQILQNWFCKSNQVCDSYKFTIKQLSKAGITNNPPPGSDNQQSICSTNTTCIGSPQIVTFLHHEFRQKYKDQKYQNLDFSEETFKNLFSPYKGLLNIGFLNRIYGLGKKFDETNDQQLLNGLAEQFKADSADHAFVIWQWIKYMTNQFVLKLGRGGSRKIAGLGGVFTQAWYQVSYSFADWFLKDVYSFLAAKQFDKDCQSKLGFLSEQKAKRICNENIKDPNDYKDYYSLVQPCFNYTKFYEFQLKYEITPTKMQQYCDVDEDPSNVGLITLKIQQQVQKHYDCRESLPSKKCTDMDIIIKQLFNSTITLNPLNVESYHFYNKSTVTVNQWNSDIPAFEYKKFLQISAIQDVQQHLEYEARDLFTFDKLLNGPEVQQLFILKNDVEFYRKYHWVNPSFLRNYIRYIVIEVGFGGFTQTRSPKQLFFGYDDPFLKNLKETDTMSGGDPSIQSLIAFNELNMTQQQAKVNKQKMFTGVGNTKKTRQYESLYEKPFISINSTYYDGKQVKWEMVSPWAENVLLQGSDGFSVPPNINIQQTPPVYISSIARFAGIKFKKSIKKYDMQLWDMRIQQKALQSIEQNPENSKYFQTFHGFLNSSYQGFPLFISKNHFLDASPKWRELVEIVDQNGNQMRANDWDDTKLYVQPYTGTAFSATVYLQSNYFFRPDDILFPSQEKYRLQNSDQSQIRLQIANRMLPVVNTFRSGNISANGVDKYFGDLRDIINNKRKVAVAGWLLIALSFAIIIGERVVRIVNKNHQQSIVQEKQGKKRSLLQSEVQI